MANESSSIVAIVAIVIIVFLAIAGYYFFMKKEGMMPGTTDSTQVKVDVKPDTSSPAPSNNQ